MSRADLTLFSHLVLVLVGPGGAGPHDLVRMARQGRIYADFAESQWYAEPKRLEKLGYFSSRREPGRTRERTHYTLTERGTQAVRDWMREPARFSRVQMEPAWRLLAADLVDDETVLRSLEALTRADRRALRAARYGRGDRAVDPAQGALPPPEPRARPAHRRGARRVAGRGRAPTRRVTALRRERRIDTRRVSIGRAPCIV